MKLIGARGSGEGDDGDKSGNPHLVNLLESTTVLGYHGWGAPRFTKGPTRAWV